MAVAETNNEHEHDHDHDHHDHGEFIAHHFDSAEQQFDSGKLGIWLFLVTEVLFFSGLFVAYTLYRSHHPEIFQEAHVFLDKWLGGLNTVVLLFSSLTMAIAVRAAQLGNNKQCSIMVLITMICASVFLGVKAIEYSHKWDMGILVRSAFDLTYEHPEPANSLGISDYLLYLSIVPAALLVIFTVGAAVLYGAGKKHLGIFTGCLALTVGGYFLGAVGGHVYMGVKEGGEAHASATRVAVYADEKKEDQKHDGEDHKEGDHEHQDGEHAGHSHDGHSHGAHKFDKHHPDPEKLSRDIGIFFSIYYCMTGLHAIHIIAGIIALAWILYRSLLGHWRSDYFGPVDYVGLYWHLVDLIWIYLFPMLYLID